MLSRLIRVEYNTYHDIVIASDSQGRIHKLDRDLNVIASSIAPLDLNRIYCIVSCEKYIYTRNIFGVINMFDIDTLTRIKTLDTATLSNRRDAESPSPGTARGIALFNGYLYTTNGFGELLKIDKNTLTIESTMEHPTNQTTFIDCINVEFDNQHFLSDKEGYVFIGDLEKMEFEKSIQVDEGSVHVVKYDKRHDRLIATQDFGIGISAWNVNGIVTLDYNDLSIVNYPFTTDDVEFIFFDPSYSEVYTGGFDGKIYVYNNEEKDLKLKRVLGPFNHQISYAISLGDNEILALLQSGELIKVNKFGKILKELDYSYVCYWGFVPKPDNESIIYAPDGSGVSIFKIDHVSDNDINLSKIVSYRYNFGLIHKLLLLKDDHFIALSRDNIVFRADAKGNILWYTHLEFLPKNFACSESLKKLIVGLDNRCLQELDLDTGELLKKQYFDSSVYVCSYNNNDVLVGTSGGKLHVLDENWKPKRDVIELGGYPKRLYLKDGLLTIVGGEFGFIEIEVENYTVVKSFIGDIIYNTREDAVKINNLVFIGSYGYQVGIYDYETENLVGLLENEIPDYVKSMYHYQHDNADYLIIGGNTGFIQAYRVHGQGIDLIREYRFI
ncbi:hypothetical protein GCM10007425_30320 [Lysinibacillus alkalisoli]|uniref:WD40 repeat domain-containing protein n=1 Tax=Lysinibacillus alkalisoli TaxID=1911548 RepID=A0A917LK02_9BACI|nr:WD40 repeat domain-containing protein [Lysinibacillus alkalisoli]GGG33554.1 hypothetical protein GCM10007425_30320 [Lysinibacillus alkalisoli]